MVGMNKKLFILLGVFVAAYLYWFFAVKPDYSKIAFVLPSSQRVSSPYYYKKDGDFFLADDLRKGLEKLGYQVSYRFREDYDNMKLGNIGNVIYFKGYYDFEHLPGYKKDKRKRVLYLYYVEGLFKDIFNEVDVVTSSSYKIIDELVKPAGAKAVYVPQFTNPERFKPAEKEQDKSFKVLFVGSNNYTFGRKSVDYAILAGVDLAVFGKNWAKTLDVKYLKGEFINNDELYKYYANADIVLNDHREDMRYFGSVSNRIFDVTASGGFVLTDYLPEIEQIYGNSVATYKDYYEFKEKLEYYLAHPDERELMAQKAREITLKNFTNDKVAEIFDGIFKNITK